MKLKDTTSGRRLNVEVTPDLRREVKTAAARADQTVKDWVTTAIVNQLANPSNTRADRPFDGSAN